MNVISVIGAGGKTTLIYRMADQYQKSGQRVLICTATHMYRESETDLSCNPDQIVSRLENDRRCMAGRLCEKHPDKITALPAEVMDQVMRHADVVLIEADGAKHYPVKYPAEHEPVIVPFTTKVILVMGAWGIGHPICDTVFRYEIMSQAVGLHKDDLLTFDILSEIIQKGYLKKIQRINPKPEVQILFSEMIDGELRYIDYEEAWRRYKIQ